MGMERHVLTSHITKKTIEPFDDLILITYQVTEGDKTTKTQVRLPKVLADLVDED